MQPPFSADDFFEVFHRYNEGVWPAQLVLVGIAVMAVLLVRVDTRRAHRVIAGSLAILWAWMAVAYHFNYFRAINPIAIWFGILFLAGALAFLPAGALRGNLQFTPHWNAWSAFGALLIIYSLIVYPLVSWALGHRYPAMPTFGLPCPTTLFSIGLLAFVAPPIPRYVLVVPILWALVGMQAAWLFGLHQDLALIVAAAFGLALVARSGNRATMRRVVSGAALYFLLIFGIGFVLGPIRVLWLAPRVGDRAAELLEMPIMLGASLLAAYWIVRRLRIPASSGQRLAMGALALALLLAAEFSLVLWLRGLSITDYVANRDPVSGIAYLLALIVFALMPMLVPSDDREARGLTSRNFARRAHAQPLGHSEVQERK